jgi:hypothetical protein
VIQPNDCRAAPAPFVLLVGHRIVNRYHVGHLVVRQ